MQNFQLNPIRSPLLMDGFSAFAPDLAINNDGFDAEYFKYLFEIESHHFWFQIRAQLIALMIQKYFNSAKSFFEIGCGTGYVLSFLEKSYPQMKFFGSDIYVSSLPYAKNRLKISTHLFQMDCRDIPFRNQFDLIGAFDVLEHITEDEQVLAEIYNALTPVGGLILTVPQHMFLWSQTDEIACHKRRYQVGEMEKKLVLKGFHIEYTTSFVTGLMPLVLISRITNKKRKTNYEMEISKFLNWLFYKILKFDFCLIKFGANLPFGVSRLIVAKKLPK